MKADEVIPHFSVASADFSTGDLSDIDVNNSEYYDIKFAAISPLNTGDIEVDIPAITCDVYIEKYLSHLTGA